MLNLARYLLACGMFAGALYGASGSAMAEDLSKTPLAQVVSVSMLLDEARKVNPQIKSARAKWEAAKHRIIKASWLEQPKASYTYVGEEIQTRVGPQEKAYGISQKLPFPVKLYYRGKAASQESKAMRKLYEATELKVLTQIKQSYYELFWIRKAIDITEQDKALLEHLEQVARSRFAAGSGRQQDVSKAQVEISRAIDRLLVLRQRSKTVEERLNALLGRKAGAEIGQLEKFELPKLDLSVGELQYLAGENRQEILAADHRVKRDKSRVGLAWLNYIPDVTTRFNYVEIGSGETTRPDDGDDAWSVTFTIDIPIWERIIYASVKEAKAEAASSKAQYEDVRNHTAFEVSDAQFRWETAKNLVDLYSSAVIPQAEQALDAAEAAYQAGNADFLNLLDSERVWLNAQLTYWRAYADAAKHLAAIERATGIELTQDVR